MSWERQSVLGYSNSKFQFRKGGFFWGTFHGELLDLKPPPARPASENCLNLELFMETLDSKHTQPRDLNWKTWTVWILRCTHWKVTVSFYRPWAQRKQSGNLSWAQQEIESSPEPLFLALALFLSPPRTQVCFHDFLRKLNKTQMPKPSPVSWKRTS